MENFFETMHCRSEAHCARCRDLDGGRRWRNGLLLSFAGLNQVDFLCPQGRPWGYRGKPQRQPEVKIPDWLRRLSISGLEARLAVLGDAPLREAGLEKARRGRGRIRAAKCKECTQRRVEAELRMWMTKRGITPCE